MSVEILHCQSPSFEQRGGGQYQCHGLIKMNVTDNAALSAAILHCQSFFQQVRVTDRANFVNRILFKIWQLFSEGPPFPPKHSSLMVTLSVTGTISNSWCSNIDKVLTVQHAEQISSIVSPLLLTVQPCQSFIFYPLSLNLPSGRGVLDSYLKGCYWHCSHVKNKPALSVFAWRIMRVWIRYKQLLLILQPI